jgi:predicted lipoprotein with Yx(FWY)xxD motif
MRAAIFAMALLLGMPASAFAQPMDLPIPPATTTQYPPGVSVRQTPKGPVYVDSRGLTLYGMDMRNGLIRWSPDPSQYCQGECAKLWEPLLAPPGSKPNIEFPRGFGPPQRAPAKGSPEAAAVAQRLKANSVSSYFQYYVPDGYVVPQSAPDWSIIAGPQGPQWVYKGWHMVFVRRGSKPGSTQYDGADNFTWNTLKYVPPVPDVNAPDKVTAKYMGKGLYALADADGHVLFTGSCKSDCEGWVPLRGAMGSHGMGDWAMGHDDDGPQWMYRGHPVFVSQDAETDSVPKGGQLLRP